MILKQTISLMVYCAFVTLSPAEVKLVSSGAPINTIYVSQDGADHADMMSVASDLIYHIEKMTGQRMNLVSVKEPQEVQDTGIILGSLASQFGLTLPETKFRDSVRLKADGKRLLILGESARATTNGVYVLLEKLGCEWTMPGKLGEVIPRSATVDIPEMDITETPGFPERKLWYTGGKSINTAEELADFEVWNRRQKIGVSESYPQLGVGHIWQEFIKRHKADFDADPTMYALIRQPDGSLVRKGPQLEPGHPKVIDLFIQDIRDEYAKNGWPKTHVAAFGVGPADGYGFSISPEFVANGSGLMDPLAGSPDVTDNLVLLANTILERIGTEYPNLSLGFYSYSVHETFPQRYKPHARLNQIFAPINFSRYQSINSTNSKSWPFYRKVVEDWSAVSKEHGSMLSYRGYNWNLAENMSPYSKLAIYADEIPWYHEKGFTSVNMEFVKAWAVTGPSDFLLAKLLWNPRADWKKVLHRYCEKAFGAGATPMEEYFVDLTNRQYSAGQEAGSYHALHLIFDQDFIALQEKRVGDAVAAASTPEEKARAAMFLGPLKQLSAFLKMREAIIRFDAESAAIQYKEMLDLWQSSYDEQSLSVSKYVPRYLERFWGAFIREFQVYSSSPYRIVYPFPDQLKTMLDPYNTGEKLGFQSADLNDADYIQTKTWSLPWDAQGLGAYRSGAVWYRIPFQRDDVTMKEPLGLFLGGVDDQAFVWLNGVLVGQSDAKFSAPSVFDLSGKARAGDNRLVIKVVRNSPANELGTGGIIRSSFLFTGPEIRLPEKKSDGKKLRVLPGGELGPAES